MKRIFFAFFFLVCGVVVFGQRDALGKAFQKFENDVQLKNALSSLYVVDTKTGKMIFDKNSTIGLAPGSTQKIVTSAAAYELLGRNFRYKTEFGLITENGEASLYVKPSGDPTLGSERWDNTKDKNVLGRLLKAYKANASGISKIYIDTAGWNYEIIPDGWIWQDIGNYFGAGADILNWKENQFDLFLKSGTSVGSRVEIVGTEPSLYSYKITSLASAGPKGSGDNSYIYFPSNGASAVIRGTIPIGENRFKVSGAMPDVKRQFGQAVLESLSSSKNNATFSDKIITVEAPKNFKLIHTENSPSLDSIIYWLNKKSINLFAEALVKTIGFQKANAGSTENGAELIKQFWKSKGIDERALNILDGSGLSPSNRITTQALVAVLLYAKKQPWYKGFYNSLPEFNGIKMKSGTIKDVKGFAGYHTSGKGVEYAFSFLVNNYNGPTSSLVQKMYQVLNELK